MSLTSSLFSGISGLTTLGNSMQIIGDNIANVNTVGFKGSNYIFQDLLSQNTATQSGTAQIGRGTALGAVVSGFQQGSFDSTGNTTDLAIGGQGFFILRESGTQSNFYTRAGNFQFDKDGYLVTAEGFIVQGWQLDANGEDIGSVGDIQLESFTSPPSASTLISVITNLDADSTSNTAVLPNAWDSSNALPIAASNYEYQTTVKVFDSLGSTHDITVYYDKKSGSKWEYLITGNPGEDQRNLVQGTDATGVYAKGTITFSDSSGTISDLTMYRFTGRIGNINATGSLTRDGTNFTILNYAAMGNEGLGFTLEYDGSTWAMRDVDGDGAAAPDPEDLPINYKTAVILTSNDQQIDLDLDNDGQADLRVNLDSSAQALDSVSFDICDPNNIHIQNITNTTYSGDTANDNTKLTINEPDVLNRSTDSRIRLNYNSGTGTWSWNPSVTNLVGDGVVIDTANVTYSFSPSVTTIASTAPYNLAWDGANWGWGANHPGTAPDYPAFAVGTSILVDSASQVAIDMNNDGTADITYNFNPPLGAVAGTLDFDIAAGAPAEYATASFVGDDEKLTLDMDNDGTDDLTFEFTNKLLADSSIEFDVVGSTAWETVATNSNGYYEFEADFLGGTGTDMKIEFDIGTQDDGTGSFVNDSLTSTQFSRASVTTFQAADGYGAGDLQGVDVDVDGVITGIYSNGELIELYRVALAKFLSQEGLFKEGGNLYRETRESGDPITGRPGSNGLGSITPNSLEQSNVDIATEFVKMITTQRGYQANSKIITTVDAMLAEAINMKR